MNYLPELKHFRLDEFACRCCGKNGMNEAFVGLLDNLREEFGLPMNVNSGFRCSKHNKNIGGSPNSKHLVGLACDISTDNFNAENKYKLIHLAFDFGVSGIGIYERFVHLDLRSRKTSFWRI